MEAHPIVIAGAGPGGLVAAIALRHVGLPVLLLEQAPEIRAAGAGLTLQVNAMRMLAPLGLDDEVAAAGEVLGRGTVESAGGKTLSEISMEEGAARHGAPAVGIHRAALARSLARALPAGVIRFESQVTGFEQDDAGVRVQLADGTAVEGTALVGADGIHSRVRAGLFGDQPIRYAGYTCWRGIAEVARPLGPGGMTERWGRGRRFGIVPISATETYWFATQNAPEGGRDGADLRSELLSRFAEFAAPVGELLESTPVDSILRNDIIDLAPLARWTRGRVTLLGDAAHAMTPNMGQGACQAIEDAVVLADSLAGGGSVQDALTRYEARRKARALSFVTRSWQIGRAGQWENPVARAVRDGLTRMTPRAVLARTIDEAWGVEVPSLPAS